MSSTSLYHPLWTSRCTRIKDRRVRMGHPLTGIAFQPNIILAPNVTLDSGSATFSTTGEKRFLLGSSLLQGNQRRLIWREGCSRRYVTKTSASSSRGRVRVVSAKLRRDRARTKPSSEPTTVPVNQVPTGASLGAAASVSASKNQISNSGTLPIKYATSPAEPYDILDGYRGLILDLAYRPINIVCWKRAICLDILEKADVLEYYDQVVQSTSQAFPLPAVLRMSNFVHAPKEKQMKLSLSRNNVFLRDKFRCQYCNCREQLTIDHVKPLSRGGGWSWENLVAACAPCNAKKGDKTPAEAGMKLTKMPREPSALDTKKMPPNYKIYRSLTRHTRTPAEWTDWLPMKPPQTS
eukprot:jgi/Mesen1/1431/ME001303S00472